MKKFLCGVLAFFIVCSGVFAGFGYHGLNGEIAAKFNISFDGKKLVADKMSVYEELGYKFDKYSVKERVSYGFDLDGRVRENEKLTAYVSASMGNLASEEAKDNYVCVDGLISLPRVKGQFKPEVLEVNVGLQTSLSSFSLGNTEYFDYNFEKGISTYPGVRVGYVYSFANDPSVSGLRLSLCASTTSATDFISDNSMVKVFASALIHRIDNTYKIENGTAGAYVKFDLSMKEIGLGLPVEGIAEYRYSYNKDNSVNGFYFTLQSFPLLSSLADYNPNTGIDIVVSAHNTDAGFSFEFNRINIPLVIVLDIFPSVLDTQSGIGLRKIEYVYSAENAPEDNGFFAQLQFDLSKTFSPDYIHHPELLKNPWHVGLSSTNRFTLKILRENQKLKTNLVDITSYWH